jgi:gamma-glutamyltranspeptidase/glutathione hydrolase
MGTKRGASTTVVILNVLWAVFSQPVNGQEARRAYRPDVPGTHGLVTAGHPLAATAGLRMLLCGGNAVDAAVATLATLNVVRPQMSGAAGNGFFTIYDSATDRVYSLNATGAAPAALDAGIREPDELSKGIYAGVVPGLFGGWVAVLDRFGTMSLAEVLEPAIDYAENGHPIEASVVDAIEAEREVFAGFASSTSVFLRDGKPPTPNSLFRMPDLARTFRKVAEAEQTALKQGKSRSQALAAAFDRFYTGDIAQEMARFYESQGGLFTMEDFVSYQPIWAEPVHTNYRGYDVYSSPSTSRGGLEVVLQLNLIERFDVAKLGHNSPEMLHLVAEVIKLAKADVYAHVADPKTTKLPSEWLLSKDRARRRSATIDLGEAMAYPAADGDERSSTYPPDLASIASPAERSRPGSTDSFSIIDRFGNAVACTPTHGSLFGTGVVVGRTGLTFNNGTRVGSTAPYPDHVNYARGGQIPILNNSPIIVLKDGELMLAIGTPGGETIGQTQFQVLLNILEFGMSIQEAIEAARISLDADPNFYKAGSAVTVRVENRISPETVRGLEALGHKIELIDGWALGSMQGILKDLETGAWLAGADPRRVAYAVGY